jgi:sRNA-binding protein
VRVAVEQRHDRHAGAVRQQRVEHARVAVAEAGARLERAVQRGRRSSRQTISASPPGLAASMSAAATRLGHERAHHGDDEPGRSNGRSR